MRISALLLLIWKSFVRHPLVEQIIFSRFFIGIYIILLYTVLYIFGTLFHPFLFDLFPNNTNFLDIFIYSALSLIFLDFLLKLLLKKSEKVFANFIRFPRSKKKIFIFSITKESLNIWNFYLIIFFFSFLTNSFCLNYGLWITISAFIFLYLSQVAISLCVNYIKEENSLIFYNFLISNRIFVTEEIMNYILLNIKMIFRSPLLRRNFITYLVLFLSCSYMFASKEMIMIQFLPTKIIFISIFMGLFPAIFNQFLFSAEASFFDQLMISPNFKKILPAKYFLNTFFSFLSYFLLLFFFPFSLQLFIEFTAVFLYVIGVVNSLLLCTILFVEAKIDLFGAFYKNLISTQSVQSLAILLIFSFSIFLIYFISLIFSTQITVVFMMISGGISILFHQKWLNYLYRCFYTNRHTKMEIFRIQ